MELGQFRPIRGPVEVTTLEFPARNKVKHNDMYPAHLNPLKFVGFGVRTELFCAWSEVKPTLRLLGLSRSIAGLGPSPSWRGSGA